MPEYRIQSIPQMAVLTDLLAIGTGAVQPMGWGGPFGRAAQMLATVAGGERRFTVGSAPHFCRSGCNDELPLPALAQIEQQAALVVSRAPDFDSLLPTKCRSKVLPKTLSVF